METVECIVVGGGLAGLSAAYGLAEAGLEVMVLERGDYSGAKNVTGGRLYVKPIRGFYPELWDEAPFERPVARELVTMMADGAHTTIEIASDRFTGGQAAELHHRARQARPVARREGHGEGRDGRAQHEGRRAAAQGRPRDRHPRRRRRDRRERRHRRRGRAAAAQQRGRAGRRAAGAGTTRSATRRSSSCRRA